MEAKRKIYQVMGWVTIGMGDYDFMTPLFTCSTRKAAEEYKSFLEKWFENAANMGFIFKPDVNKFAVDSGVGIDLVPYRGFSIREIDLVDTCFPSIKEAEQYFMKKQSGEVTAYNDVLPSYGVSRNFLVKDLSSLIYAML